MFLKPFACIAGLMYLMRYNVYEFEIRQTAQYSRWFSSLRDRVAQAKINIRIRRLSLGNLGDSKSVSDGVCELRINFGPGYRIYFVQRGSKVVLLLAGGVKSSQSRDIATALKLVKLL